MPALYTIPEVYLRQLAGLDESEQISLTAHSETEWGLRFVVRVVVAFTQQVTCLRPAIIRTLRVHHLNLQVFTTRNIPVDLIFDFLRQSRQQGRLQLVGDIRRDEASVLSSRESAVWQAGIPCLRFLLLSLVLPFRCSIWEA